MPIKITVDLHACQGYANCLIEGPSLFDIDDDTNKAIIIGGEEHGDTLRSEAEAAKRGCPAHAIHIEEL